MTTADSYLAALQDLVAAYFSRAELADLCLRLGVNFDSLPDAGLAEQARELILLLARQERLPALLALARAERPHVDWPPVPPGYRPPAADASPAAPAAGFSIGAVNAGNLIVGNDAVMNVSQGARYELSGDFRGAIVNIESTLRDTRQSIEALPAADDDARAELIRLVGQLDKALKATPPGREAEAAEVADITQDLVDAAGEEKPRKSVIRALGEDLKEAAEALGDDLPAVVEIAARIAAAVASLPGTK